MKDLDMGKGRLTDSSGDATEEKPASPQKEKKENLRKKLARLVDQKAWLPLELEDGLHIRELSDCESAHMQTWLSRVNPPAAEKKYMTPKARTAIMKKTIAIHEATEKAFKGKFGSWTEEEKAAAFKEMGVEPSPPASSTS